MDINIVVGIIVVIILIVAVRRFVGVASGKKGCCSDEGTGISTCNTAKAPDPGTPKDQDESHYPYTAVYEIGGMTCENCVRHVTSALNSVEGTWATVTLAGGQARVRSKNPLNVDAYKKAVESAGYRLHV